MTKRATTTRTMTTPTTSTACSVCRVGFMAYGYCRTLDDLKSACTTHRRACFYESSKTQMDGAPIERSKAQQPQKQRLEIPEHSLRFDLVVTTAPSTIMTHHHGSALNKHHARHARASCYNGTGHHQERLQVVRARKETPTRIHIDGSASTA